jgi:ribosome biogenesis GTPase A
MIAPKYITRCVPFIQFEAGRGFRIESEALRYLLGLPPEDSYAVVSIIGKSKTGKSFLMNKLLGDDGMFPVNHGVGGGSEGISIATKLL